MAQNAKMDILIFCQTIEQGQFFRYDIYMLCLQILLIAFVQQRLKLFYDSMDI